MKCCSKCKVEKHLSEFHKRGSGASSSCKTCRSQERKEKYANNPDLFREISREWRANNPDKAKQIYATNRAKNSESRAAASKAWRSANIDKSLESSRKYYAENRERIVLAAREKRKSDPGRVARTKLKHYHSVQKHSHSYKASEAARRALKRTMNRTGQRKARRTVDDVGYSFSEFRLHVERNFSSGMTWDNYGEWHIDHIISIAEMVRLGITCPKIINALSNLMPRWASENISKGDGFELSMQHAQ